MNAQDDSPEEAERRLDELAEDLRARGLVEFHEFFMPHRQQRSSPPTASEIYGIRFDEEVGGYRVFYRDMGVKRILMEGGTWEQARDLYVERVEAQSAYLRGRS